MKSKMKRRMLAIVLCMVIALSNSSFIFASSGTEEPAAVAQEGDPQNVQETQTEAAVQDTPAVLSETTPEVTPEATPEPTQVPEVTAAPTEAPQATAEPTQAPEVTAAPEATPAPTETPAVTAEPTQAPEITPTPTPEVTEAPEATPVPTEAPVTYNEAVELKHEFKDENGNVTATVTAQIPAGAFQADASELTMEVTVPDQATTEHVKKLMEESLPEHYMLGDTVLYDIRFKVNGTETESQQPIVITFENQNGITVKDVKKAVVFQLDPADPAVEGDKDELVTITQRNDMIESLQNSGQSTDNVDDYDLSEITLKEDGTSDKIQMEGRTSTIYGCYAYYEPVQVLTYEDDQVTVTVSAAENGVIPANAELKVVPITEDKETEDQYKDVEKKLQEKAEEEEYEIAGFLAYDITFVDPEGNETEPNGEVKVSIDYNEAAIPESVSEEDVQNAEVTVMHLEEDEKGEVKEVVDMAQNEQVDVLAMTEENKVEKAEVRTESFSIYSILWREGEKQLTIEVKYYYYDGDGFEKFSPDSHETITLGPGGRVDLEVATTENKIPAQYTINNDTYKYAGARVNNPATGERMTYIDAQYNNNSWQAYYGIEYALANGATWKTFNNKYDVCLVYSKSDDLPTIETVDSKSKGVTIKMFDYASANPSGSWGSYGDGTIKSGLLEKELVKSTVWKEGKKIEEYLPVAKNGDYEAALKNSFSIATNNYLGEANNLFSEEIYEEEGYFYYSSFDNYAYLSKEKDSDGLMNYTVYDVKGTPSNADAYYYQRGNFMPFNEIMAGYLSDNTVQYDEDGKELEYGTEGKGEKLYHTVGVNDYYFGMVIESAFYQPVDGKVNDKDMTFEFNGDDDMWVFIDGVLVLDIGGIHDAHSGSINFATGVVTWTDCETGKTPVTKSSTIRQMFQGTSKLDTTDWDGNTFADYSAHDIAIYYMERGASASNCKIKFNLQTIPDGQIQVEKHLNQETDPVKYGDVEFGFKLYVEKADADGQGTGNYNQVTKETLEQYKATIQGKDGNRALTMDEEGRFYIKPEEIAYFNNIPENLKYYVVEVDVKSEEYDEIFINNTPVIEDEYESSDGKTYKGYSSGEDTVKHRPVVSFTNSCSAANMRTLTITKKMKNDEECSNVFNIFVELEDVTGRLKPYAGKYTLYSEENTQGVLKTTENGYITLKADESACIYNILSDTKFRVTENITGDVYATPEYSVKTNRSDGFKTGNSGKIELNNDSSVIVTNSYKASIQVSKIWNNLNTSTQHDSVYVGLYEVENDIITPVEGQWKELSEDRNWGASFVGIDANKTYTVRELRIAGEDESVEFQIDGQKYVGVLEGASISNQNIQYTVGYSTDNIELTDNNNSIVITNTQMWQIVKRSASTTHPILPKAEFQLVKLDENGSKTEIVYKGISDEKGIVQWNGMEQPLETGIYLLEETKAPDGYACGDNWTIEIENGLPKQITGQLGEENTGSKIQGVSYSCYLRDGIITIYYDDTPIYDLPSAGGSGIFWYLISGTAFLMAASLILYRMKRKEVLGK